MAGRPRESATSPAPAAREPPAAAGALVQAAEVCLYLLSRAEEERAEMARSLHGELGGALVAARLELAALAEGPDLESGVLARLRQVLELLQSAADVKRRLEEGLRPALLDTLGLEAALRWQVADCRARTGVRCRERYPTPEPDLTPQARITLYRVVEQALGHAVQHARAREITVALTSEGASLILAVSDDGAGEPRADARELAALRYRVEALGGEWRATRARAGGTRIEARVPLARVLRAPR